MNPVIAPKILAIEALNFLDKKGAKVILFSICC